VRLLGWILVGLAVIRVGAWVLAGAGHVSEVMAGVLADALMDVAVFVAWTVAALVALPRLRTGLPNSTTGTAESSGRLDAYVWSPHLPVSPPRWRLRPPRRCRLPAIPWPGLWSSSLSWDG
jgi:hypothetical protein